MDKFEDVIMSPNSKCHKLPEKTKQNKQVVKFNILQPFKIQLIYGKDIYSIQYSVYELGD